MKPHWRIWQALAAKEAVSRGQILPDSRRQASTKAMQAARKAVRSPHRDGNHSAN